MKTPEAELIEMMNEANSRRPEVDRVEKVWMILADRHPGEGLVSAQLGGIVVPMVATTEGVRDIIEEQMKMMLEREGAIPAGTTLRLVEFSCRKDL